MANQKKKNKLVFNKTSKGYVMKGKTIEETNAFCSLHAITFADLEKNLKGNVSIIELD